MKTTHILFLAFGAWLTTGCSDFLEEYSQDSYYASSWKDLDEVLVGSGYLPNSAAHSFDTPGTPASYLHYLADEMLENNIASPKAGCMLKSKPYTYSYYTWQQRMGQNQEYTDFYDDNQDWTSFYYHINVVNNVLAVIDDMPQATEEEIAGCHKVKGEALFLRAYNYFMLVNLYGLPYAPSTAASTQGVPLKTSENVEDRKFTRQSVQTVYNQIIADLEAARTEFIAYNEPAKSIYRADSTATNLLLSRVYLYTQQWQLAADAARRVIKAHPALQRLSDDASSFARLSNPENIFNMGGSDLSQMLSYQVQAYKVNNELYDLFDTDDLRRSQWYWTSGTFIGVTKEKPDQSWNDTPVATNDPNYYYYAHTFGHSEKKSEVSSIFLLRSAEAYLNLAEALACLGKEDEARQTWQTLRTARYKAGSTHITTTETGDALIRAIRTERRKELAFEGHRWFDLRRYAVSTVCPDAISITHEYTIYKDDINSEMLSRRTMVLLPNDPAYTLPIPYEVILFNSDMEQNANPWRTYEEVILN